MNIKKCNQCGKPIWDNDSFITIHDPYMDADEHHHYDCYATLLARTNDTNAEAAVEFFDTDFFQ